MTKTFQLTSFFSFRSIPRLRYVWKSATRHALDNWWKGGNQNIGEGQDQGPVRRWTRNERNPHPEDRATSKRHSTIRGRCIASAWILPLFITKYLYQFVRSSKPPDNCSSLWSTPVVANFSTTLSNKNGYQKRRPAASLSKLSQV